jgi:ATP-dependent DNA helicase DinG
MATVIDTTGDVFNMPTEHDDIIDIMNKRGKLIDYFPKGFIPRQQQIYILNEIEKHLRNGVKYIIINAPTGIGKSLIAITLGNYFNDCYICTGQKSLQEQYMNDFGHIVVTVKGRANFPCLEYDPVRDGPENNCDHGWCTRPTVGTADAKKKTKKKDKQKELICNDGIVVIDGEMSAEICPRTIHPRALRDMACKSANRGLLYYQSEETPCLYQEQKAQALRSKIVVTNYDYFLAAINYVGDFGKRDVIVADEGHSLEAHIANFVTVDITSYLLDRLNAYFTDKKQLHFPFTSYNDSQDDKLDRYITLAKDVYETISLAMKQLTMKQLATKQHKNEKDVSLFSNSQKKLGDFLEDIAKNRYNWVVKEERKGKNNSINKLQFCPIFIHQYTKEKFFNRGKVNIILSATILANNKYACNKFATDLGIGINEFEYITVPPVFPRFNSMIFNLSLANFKHQPNRTIDEDRAFHIDIVNKIDLILDIHPNAKGIIHCHTKKISKFIETYTRHKDRIITHDTKNRIDKLDEHCNSKKPTVLCSPSMHEGVDLKDDLSRFQIIVKIQYPNAKEERIEQRLKVDPTYLYRQAALAFAQALGRSVRSETDYARTYTIDSRFPDFIRNNYNYLGDIVAERIKSEADLRILHKKESRVLDNLFKRV